MIKTGWTVSPGVLIDARRRGIAIGKGIQAGNKDMVANAMRGHADPDVINSIGGYTYNGYAANKPTNIFSRFADNVHNKILKANAMVSGYRSGRRFGQKYPEGLPRQSNISRREVNSTALSSDMQKQYEQAKATMAKGQSISDEEMAKMLGL